MTQGFIFTWGDKMLFLESARKNINDEVARQVIFAVCNIRNTPAELMVNAMKDRNCLQDFKRRIDRARMEKVTTDGGYQYYKIEGKNFCGGYPLEEENVCLFIREEKGV